MIYTRAIYDLVTIVKLFVDKVEPADQVQVLALLKNVRDYLEVGHTAVAVKFDEPLVTVSKLIQSIEDISQVRQLNAGKSTTVKTNGLLVAGEPLQNSSTLQGSSALHRSPVSRRPPVYKRAGVKRPPPPAESDSNEDFNDDRADDLSDSESDRQEVYEEVVEDDTEWQPLDLLEQALTAVAKEQSKTSYVYNSAPSSLTNPSKHTHGKKRNAKLTNPKEPKLYLPEDVEFSNPTPQIVRKEGDRKWPENSKWICVYCRLIVKNLKSYKAHLNFHHKTVERCCCRFCRRELPNVEMLKFHLCSVRHQCHICKKFFGRPNKLRRHIATHFKSMRALVQCQICNEKYKNATECAKHVYEYHESIILCDCCGLEFNPHTSESRAPGRIYCDPCAASSVDGEPEADPANLNPDILIKNVKYDANVDKSTYTAIDIKRENNNSSCKAQLHCDICDEDVIGDANWNKHILKSTHIQAAATDELDEQSGAVACKVCGRIFINQKKLDFHSRVHLKGYHGKTFTCKTCGKELLTIGGYRTHVASHSNLRKFECQECDKSFNNVANLYDHRDSMHASGKTFPCAYCEEKFQTRKIRSKHVSLYHHNHIYRCAFCEFESRTGDHIRTHITSYHPTVAWTKPKDYRQVADQPYKENETPSKKSKLSVERAVLYSCDLCKLDYSTQFALRIHARSKSHVKKEALSKGLKPEIFPCFYCDKEFHSLKNLDEHIKRNHDEDAVRYECEQCDKIYVTSHGLKVHEMSHSGDRKYKCTLCDAAYFSSGRLASHMEVKHDNKEFPCESCDMVLKNRKLKTRHVNLVHKNYIYYCTGCDYETRFPATIKKHVTSQHPTVKWTQPRDYRHVADAPYVTRKDGKRIKDVHSEESGKNYQDSNEASTSRNAENVSDCSDEEGWSSDNTDASYNIVEVKANSKVIAPKNLSVPPLKDNSSTSTVVATAKVNPKSDEFVHFLETGFS